MTWDEHVSGESDYTLGATQIAGIKLIDLYIFQEFRMRISLQCYNLKLGSVKMQKAVTVPFGTEQR